MDREEDQNKQPDQENGLEGKETTADEKRDNYIDDMIKQIQNGRKSQYCWECCCAYWLFLILGGVFTAKLVKEECFWMGNLCFIFTILCSCFTCCRICDCLCIICPLGRNSLHWATDFHRWNNQIQYETCKWFLILLTIIWFFFETCDGFRPIVTGFLIFTWILVIIWKCLESD